MQITKRYGIQIHQNVNCVNIFPKVSLSGTKTNQHDQISKMNISTGGPRHSLPLTATSPLIWSVPLPHGFWQDHPLSCLPAPTAFLANSYSSDFPQPHFLHQTQLGPLPRPCQHIHHKDNITFNVYMPLYTVKSTQPDLQHPTSSKMTSTQ